MIRLQRPTYSQRVQSLLNNRRQNARICVQMRRIDKRCGCCLLMSRLFVQGFPREKTNSPQRRDGTGRDEHEQIRLDSEELVGRTRVARGNQSLSRVSTGARDTTTTAFVASNARPISAFSPAPTKFPPHSFPVRSTADLFSSRF